MDTRQIARVDPRTSRTMDGEACRTNRRERRRAAKANRLAIKDSATQQLLRGDRILAEATRVTGYDPRKNGSPAKARGQNLGVHRRTP